MYYMTYLYVTFCTHGSRLKEWSLVCHTSTVHIPPSLHIVQSIHYQLLVLEEDIMVDISLCSWVDFVLLGLDV